MTNTDPTERDNGWFAVQINSDLTVVDEWDLSWDGEVYEGRAKADAELAACRAAGYTCRLVKMEVVPDA